MKKIIFAILMYICFVDIMHAENIPVLTFHSISNKELNTSKYSTTISSKKLQLLLETLKNHGFYSITISELLDKSRMCRNGTPIVLTFDDGFYDFYTNALPILKKEGFGANLAIITSKIGKKGFLGESELKEISKLQKFSILSHTNSHRDLTNLSGDVVEQEAIVSKKTLEKITNQPISYLAYPYGTTSKSVIDYMKKQGYQAGFTNKIGFFNIDKSNSFYIPRIRVDNQTNISNLLDYITLK